MFKDSLHGFDLKVYEYDGYFVWDVSDATDGRSMSGGRARTLEDGKREVYAAITHWQARVAHNSRFKN